MRYGRDVLKVDDWSTMLADIKTTESSCSALLEVVNAGKLDNAWKEQESRMDKMFHSQEEHYSSIQQKTGQLAVDLRQSIEEQRHWHRTEEENRCLQALCTTTYIDHKDLNPDRVQGTCQWLLNNEKFHELAESGCSELLWVTADPGCGKSVLSKSLVDCELRSTLSLTTAYFFFKDNISKQESATHALCALVHQLCIQNRALLRKAVDAYNNNGKQFTLSFAWMWQLLLTVAQIPEAGEIICIVDALDECQKNDRETLISSLNDFYGSQKDCEVQLKFLVTSRPYYDIEESFDHNTIRLAGEDESETTKHEINLVIMDRIPKIASRKRLDHRTRAALEDRLLQTENRTYLWLHLTLDSIEKELGLATPQKMIAFIRELPRTIDQAYEAMLCRCRQPHQARKMLHIILAARRPLTLREMNMAYHIEPNQKSREEVDLFPEESFGSYVKNLCGLLVRIYDSKIFLLHETVKEFLVSGAMSIESIDSNGVWRHSMEPQESNLILAKKCLCYLSFYVFDEKSDIFCSDEALSASWHSSQHLIEHCYEAANYEFLNYAALNWVDHFGLARTEQELTRMWSFICDEELDRFTNWLNIWLYGVLLDQGWDIDLLTLLYPLNLSPLNFFFTFQHDEQSQGLYARSFILDARKEGLSAILDLFQPSSSIAPGSNDSYPLLAEVAREREDRVNKERLDEWLEQVDE